MLSVELDPLKEEARVSKALVEENDRQIARLEDENHQWKERKKFKDGLSIVALRPAGICVYFSIFNLF